MLMMTAIKGGHTQEKNKIKWITKKCIRCIPKKVYENGVVFHPDCKNTKKSWGLLTLIL